ncbi:Icc-related predicted phosphoesterase [Azospirillum agricola]|uniref:metallophosphoesterase family protein n=1 Tax=Azospirillum agricola TaxID=1720247 RepID=UPI001AEA3C63|nr:metallophosphoesterase [Azospirillum agricola]MBP2229043.1 Icc-related predicted phosphoesterase [Azospirillum agricola]
MHKERLTVAAIGDIHVGETTAHPYRELFHEIAGRADVLALAGDLTNHGKPREAEILAEDLRAIGIPVVAVLGNHDHECGQSEESQRILEQAGVRFLDGAPQEIHGVGFAGVKGFGGGFGNRMLDSFGEPAIKQFVHESVNEAMRLESALRQLETERIVVVLHYAPIAATVEGEPTEIFPFLGSSRLAETIDRFETVRAVVHGHAHHGTYSGHTLRGTPVYNVAQTIPKDTGRPYALIEV